jgi:hypothetical protein
MQTGSILLTWRLGARKLDFQFWHLCNERFVPLPCQELVMSACPTFPWYQSYRRAVLAEDLISASRYVPAALSAIQQRLCEPELEPSEREALVTAARFLHLIEVVELRAA